MHTFPRMPFAALGIGLIVAMPSSTHADDLPIKIELDQLEETVVTGTRLHDSFRANVQRLELTSGANSTEQLLQSAPSLEINPNAGAGSLNDLHLRGADPNLTLVLFNGVPLNDSTNSRGGVADLTGIDHWFLDRIEIATGATSAIYGSQAVAGALHLVSGINGDDRRITAAIDSENGHHLAFRQSGKGWSLGLSRKTLPETYAGSHYQSHSGLVQTRSNVGRGALQLGLWVNSAQASAFADDSGGDQFAVNRTLEQRDIREYSFSAAYNAALFNGDLEVQYSRRNKTEDIDTPGIAPGLRDPFGLPALISDNRLELDYLALSQQWQGQRWQLLVGADYQREQGRHQGQVDFGFFSLPTNFDQRRSTTGLFAELNTNLTERLQLKLAGRRDRADSSREFSPSVLLQWQVSDNNQLYASWGEGFKLPGFFALANPLVGNPNLNNETSDTREAGFSHQQAHWSGGLRLYDYRFKNLIDFDPGPPPSLVNRSQVQSRGAEIWIRLTPQDSAWNLNASYSYNRSRTETGQSLLGRPEHRLQGRLEHQWQRGLLGNPMTWFVEVKQRSSVLGSSIPTAQVSLDGYLDLSSGLSLSINTETRWLLGVNNLLSEEREVTPGNRHSGAWAWMRIEHQF